MIKDLSLDALNYYEHRFFRIERVVQRSRRPGISTSAHARAFIGLDHFPK
jgi:hypothetical protein